jgi:hypothetical protein
MTDYAKGVKKVYFDGTKENLYLWTTQLLGSAAKYNCKQAILGTGTISKATDVLGETQDADKKLMLARKMNDLTMCFFNLSLTDKVSQMVLYNGITTELPDGDAAKVWKTCSNFFMLRTLTR